MCNTVPGASGDSLRPGKHGFPRAVLSGRSPGLQIQPCWMPQNRNKEIPEKSSLPWQSKERQLHMQPAWRPWREWLKADKQMVSNSFFCHHGRLSFPDPGMRSCFCGAVWCAWQALSLFPRRGWRRVWWLSSQANHRKAAGPSPQQSLVPTLQIL